MIDQDLRDALAAAQTTRAQAYDAVAAARATLARSADAIAAADAKARSFSDLGHRVSTHHAGRLKAGKEVGDLPASIRADQLAQRDAMDSLDGLNATYAMLSRELADAEAAAKLAEFGVRDAASRLLIAEAQRVATKLEQAKADAYRLDLELRGISSIWVPDAAGRPAPIQIGYGALAALHAEVGIHPGDAPTATRRFARFFEDLQSDPAAEIAPTETLLATFMNGKRL